MSAHGAEGPRLLLDLNQVATQLSVGRTLVAKLVYSAELPSITVGRRRLVRVEDLTEFIERRKNADGALGHPA